MVWSGGFQEIFCRLQGYQLFKELVIKFILLRLADMVSAIKNGIKCKNLKVRVRSSRLCLAVLKQLLRRGFIVSFKSVDYYFVEIELKYIAAQQKISLIGDIKVISRPGYLRSVTLSQSTLERRSICFGQNVSVLVSTDKGVLFLDEAISSGLGGVWLVYVW